MKSTWRRLRPLLQPEANPVAIHFADEYAAFLARKVENIRSSTASAPPLDISHRSVQDPLVAIDPMTVEEVTLLLKNSPAKHCSLDPVPTWLIKKVGSAIAPVIAIVYSI